MKSFAQIAAVFLSPLVLIGWVYGLARLGMHLWGWELRSALVIAFVVTMLQIALVCALAPAVFEDGNNG